MPDTRFVQGTTTRSTFREPPIEAATSLYSFADQHRFGHFHADSSLPRPVSSTRSSFRGHGKEAFSEENRPKAVLPKHNLGVKESGCDNEVFKDPPPRPTSAMSDAFQAPAADVYSGEK